MFPVKNFISLATTRSGSMCKSLLDVARVTAFDTILPATCTAAAHAEDRFGVLWYCALWARILTSNEAALKQSEHGENTDGLPAVRVFRSNEAPGRSCMAAVISCRRAQLNIQSSGLC